MTAVSYVQRVCDNIKAKGQRFLSDLQRRSGAKVEGEIFFTHDPSRRYARVHQDPDAIFVDPSIDWTPLPPRYEIWIGRTETDARRILRASSFALAHEAAHVIEDSGRKELEIDRLALRLTGSRADILWSMVGVSKMVIEDLQEGGIREVKPASAKREAARLGWVMGDTSLPQSLRDEALQLQKKYLALLGAKR